MGLSELIATRLPMNRKERFFTGTVFPMIVGCEDLRYVDRFLSLAGVTDLPAIDADPLTTGIQFFTEYGFLESRHRVAEGRFPTVPAGRDTPDILIYVDGDPGAIIGVEAKMFDTPTAGDLNAQLAVQRTLLEGIVDDLGRGDSLYQLALLPAPLAESVGSLHVPTVTWEQLLAAYSDVAPSYWKAMLAEALDGYEDLVSVGPAFGKNKDGKLSGQAIVDGYGNGDLEFTWMGRVRGLQGPELADDVASGAWRSRRYEVRVEPLGGNPNWFPIADFVTRVEATVGVT